MQSGEAGKNPGGGQSGQGSPTSPHGPLRSQNPHLPQHSLGSGGKAAVPGEGSGTWHLCVCIRRATTSTLEPAELKGWDRGLCSHPGLSMTPRPCPDLAPLGCHSWDLGQRQEPSLGVVCSCCLQPTPPSRTPCSPARLPAHPLPCSRPPQTVLLAVEAAGPGTAQAGPAEPLMGTRHHLQVESGPVGEPGALLLPGARAHAAQGPPTPEARGASGRWICARCPLPTAAPPRPWA